VKQRQGTVVQAAQPIKSLIQRFAYVGLVMLAIAVLMFGKADAVLIEQARIYVTDAVAPVLNLLSRPAATLSNWVNQGNEMIALREENARLREENSRLLQWQTVARKLDAENSELRGLSKFQPQGTQSYISARVIADAGGTFAHSLVLSAGRRSGVEKGQAVISGEGLVGRVHGVGPNSSRVLLITDLNSRIPVMIEETRVRAILAGNNSTRTNLIHLPPGASASPGDRVITSGHGGAFPWGLPVGVVAAVSDERIEVQPFVDRERLEYVRAVDFGLKGIVTLPRSEEPKAKAPNKPKPKKKAKPVTAPAETATATE